MMELINKWIGKEVFGIVRFSDEHGEECKIKYPKITEDDRGDAAFTFEYASRYGCFNEVTINLAVDTDAFGIEFKVLPIAEQDHPSFNLWCKVHREQGMAPPCNELLKAINKFLQPS